MSQGIIKGLEADKFEIVKPDELDIPRDSEYWLSQDDWKSWYEGLTDPQTVRFFQAEGTRRGRELRKRYPMVVKDSEVPVLLMQFSQILRRLMREIRRGDHDHAIDQVKV